MIGIPPLDKMFLIGIWVESVLYGMNVLVYGAAMIALSRKPEGASTKVLIAVSTMAFVLSTAYVAISLRQLMEAFIYGPPGTAIAYFADVGRMLPQAKIGLYTVNVCLQDLVLIWRLWSVFGRSNFVVIIPLLLEVGRLGSSIVAMVAGGKPGVSIFTPLVHDMGIVDWTLDLALNIGVTAAIALQLWLRGRAISAYNNVPGIRSRNKYMSIVYNFIESGSLFAIATLITVSLYLSGSPATVVAIDSIVQLATITPLLIVVRVRFGFTHGAGLASTMNGFHDTSTVNGRLQFHRRAPTNNAKTIDSDGAEDYQLSNLSYTQSE
ncbi:hypothetical protein C8Q76DRAFT_796563 [Earliella scabrosa]|nr:hypothetical protein C8Q76DRAFT_796563 [Earliella scabrosa]